MSPPENEERRPLADEDGAQCLNPGEDFDASTVAGPADNGEDSDQAAIKSSSAADLAIMDAERTVARLGRAVAAMRRMPTANLRDLRWIGMMDPYWSLLHAEMAHRGEEW